MKRFVLLAVLLPLSVAHGQSKLTFPPDRLPLPAVGPTKLAPDVLYVVQNADEKLTYLLLTSPDTGIVKVTEKSGKVTIFAKFHDSDGEPVWRDYEGKQIWVVQAKAKGECELLFVPHGAPTAKDVVRKTLSIEMGQGPRPPPKPTPVPNPVKFVTLVHNFSPASLAVLRDQALDKWFAANGISVTKVPDGDPFIAQKGLAPAVKLAGGAPCVILQDAKGNLLTQSEMIDSATTQKLCEWYLK